MNFGVKNYMKVDYCRYHAVIDAVIDATFESHTSLTFFQASFSQLQKLCL